MESASDGLTMPMSIGLKERFISCAFYIAGAAVIGPPLLDAWEHYLIYPGTVNNNPLDVRIWMVFFSSSPALPLAGTFLALGYFTPVWTKRFAKSKSSRLGVVLFVSGILTAGFICSLLCTCLAEFMCL
ncbi:MAG TPA: hypothetical protein V6C81_08350 [Planktothrix sp.]|jgi:hypothetical protein